MKTVKSVVKIGKRPVYDISVADAEHYILENGVVTHNTGAVYSSNQIFFISKAQEKDGTDLAGWTFTINIEKSRYVREKSKFPFTVTFEGGINKWSGLLDIALDLGYVKKPSNGWYSRVDMETGEIEEKKFREKDTNTADFWKPILMNKKFQEDVKARFMVSNTKLLPEDSTIDEDVNELMSKE